MHGGREGAIICGGVQVQAYLVWTAVPGVVKGALGSFGTPNLLLQTELVSVPTVVISPIMLPPIVLYEGSFAASSTQNFTLNNTGNATINFQVPPSQVSGASTFARKV